MLPFLDAIWNSDAIVRFLNGKNNDGFQKNSKKLDISCLVFEWLHAILFLYHSKNRHQNVRHSNFWNIPMFGFGKVSVVLICELNIKKVKLLLYIAVSQIRNESVMSIYWQVSTRTQVVINCLMLLHQSAHKDILSQVLGSQVAPGFLEDVMSYNSLTTLCW